MADDLEPSDDERTPVAGVGAAPPVAAEPGPAAPGAVRLVAQNTIRHNGKRYSAGEVLVAGEDLSTEEAATLRESGALKLETELRSADDIAAQIAGLQARVAQLEGEKRQLQESLTSKRR